MSFRLIEIRDNNLRRQIVDALHNAFVSAEGRPLLGDALFDLANDEGGHSFIDVDHFLRLARETKAKGLIDELPGEVRRRGEAYSLRHSRWTVTSKGIELVGEQIPPVAGVYDMRISGEGVKE